MDVNASILSNVPLPGGRVIAVTFRVGNNTQPLIIFVNGLGLPAASWRPTVALISEFPCGTLEYDRPGQLGGRSPPPPADEGTHDIHHCITELETLLSVLGVPHERPLILCANSIGCPISRLYTVSPANIHHRVKALLFLDSMIANTDFVSLLPPPSDDEPEDVRKTREGLRRSFFPTLPNPEKLDRSKLAEVLPSAKLPKLPGDPFVTVVGHDPVPFLAGSEQKLGLKSWVMEKYLEPVWQSYNADLATLTTGERSRGPIIAKGADHFIQRGRPDLVAEELKRLLSLVSEANMV